MGEHHESSQRRGVTIVAGALTAGALLLGAPAGMAFAAPGDPTGPGSGGPAPSSGSPIGNNLQNFLGGVGNNLQSFNGQLGKNLQAGALGTSQNVQGIVGGTAGNIQGIMSHRDRVVLALSNLSFGPEKALTADVAGVSTEEGERLYQQVFKQWDHRRELAGFGGAMSTRGDVVGDATHVAMVMPHWFLAALALLPLLRWALGASRRWRWSRRSGKRLCWNCGYPLVHATERCPECGEAVEAEVRGAAVPGGHRPVRAPLL